MDNTQLDNNQKINDRSSLASLIISAFLLIFGLITFIIIPFASLIFFIFMDNSLVLLGGLISVSIGIIVFPIASLIGFLLGIKGMANKNKTILSIVALIISIVLLLLSITVLSSVIVTIVYSLLSIVLMAIIIGIFVLGILLLNFLINKYVPLGF